MITFQRLTEIILKLLLIVIITTCPHFLFTLRVTGGKESYYVGLTNAKSTTYCLIQDSGGFQMVSLLKLATITEVGVVHVCCCGDQYTTRMV